LLKNCRFSLSLCFYTLTKWVCSIKTNSIPLSWSQHNEIKYVDKRVRVRESKSNSKILRQHLYSYIYIKSKCARERERERESKFVSEGEWEMKYQVISILWLQITTNACVSWKLRWIQMQSSDKLNTTLFGDLLCQLVKKMSIIEYTCFSALVSCRIKEEQKKIVYLSHSE
jgi:hypothetical protein